MTDVPQPSPPVPPAVPSNQAEKDAATVRRGWEWYGTAGDAEEAIFDAEAALGRLVAALDTAEAERARLQHFIECADTPLMRDVLIERDFALRGLAAAREALRKIENLLDPSKGAIAPMNALHDARAALAGVGEEDEAG